MLCDIIGKTVFHKKFGTGVITSKKSNGIILVQFDDAEKKFDYPGVFQNQWLTTYDEELEKHIEQDVEVLKKSDFQKDVSNFNHHPKWTPKPKPKEGSNIAFKYNYCDGGEDSEWFGFSDACTDEMIRYNIKVAKRSWCSDEGCPCRRYYDGKISREDLSAEMEGDNYICQESGFCKQWCSYPERKNEYVRLDRARKNSLAILTTRKPYDAEDNRFIFCVYLVDEYSEGDADHSSGWVHADPGWTIILSKQEAYQMKFWKYHTNSNKPSQMQWNSGIVRYISDNEVVQILRDIVYVIAPEYKDYAREFLQHYCEINRINEANVPSPNGALIQKIGG